MWWDNQTVVTAVAISHADLYDICRLQWRLGCSRWIRQSTDACRYGWKVWPEDTRMAAVTSLFDCLRIFHCLLCAVSTFDQIIFIVVITVSKDFWRLLCQNSVVISRHITSSVGTEKLSLMLCYVRKFRKNLRSSCCIHFQGITTY